ncbi:hypothetical protein GCM10009555_031240 [Acrocarpospora macrocephala]|uniref:Uncharacterized protein n=1 Tax=Acrocarpospora macrocephala TaxID=150177 RepID=A0A5M3WSW3_9ACTN|nr:hypothetical protein Amac_060520 [Acrocarpospora macrocephala]
MRGGRVVGCQLRRRYATSPTLNALYRDRISLSAVGAAAVPWCSEPQHSRYGMGSPHGQAEVDAERA